MVDPRVPDALTFSAPPFEAYTLVAALQGTSRHPGLSDLQRAIVVDFARQIADGLISLARGAIGPGSAIETTLTMGFDPSFDEPREGR
jgi:hypothetical protein